MSIHGDVSADITKGASKVGLPAERVMSSLDSINLLSARTSGIFYLTHLPVIQSLSHNIYGLL